MKRRRLTQEDLLNRAIPEAALLMSIEANAVSFGWLYYHTHDSRRSAEGFPDLVLVSARQQRVVLAELKSETEHLTNHQLKWAEALLVAGEPQSVIHVSAADAFYVRQPEYYIWRPSDWRSGLVTDVLSGNRLDEALRRTIDTFEAEMARLRPSQALTR